MIKKLKPALLFLIHILFLNAVYCQAPKNIPEIISQKFLNYTSSVPREEIYVHSDREDYISGENLWFNIYLFDRQSMKPSLRSRIAYFELLNAENRPIMQKKILIDSGFGPGQIILPDTLSTGTYTVRAYTAWMKNFLPDNCFTKDIHVYNSFNNKTLNGKMKSGSVKNTPELNVSGLTMKADNLKPDILELNIATNDRYRSENGNLFYVFIQTHGVINHLSTERASDEFTRVLIPKKQLMPGINQITVFNSKGKPVGERYIYTPATASAAPVIRSADSTGLRNKISVDVDFGQNAGNVFDSAKFSISVEPVTKIHSVPDLDDYLIFGTEFGALTGNMIFRERGISEISPEEMDAFLQTVKSNWLKWDDILADQLPAFKYQIENEDHYLSGKIINNVNKPDVADKFVLLAPPGKVPVFQYAKTDNNGNFTFQIHIDGKINDIVVQPDVSVKNSTISIESPFSDKYLKSDGMADSSNRSVPDYISAWSVNQQVRKIYGISSIGNPLSCTLAVPKIKRFYGNPDSEIKLKDYIALPVMEEVFFELLAGVSLKNKKSVYEITIANADNNKKPFEAPPALFVDGVMVKDAGVIAALEPDLVETIDVLRGKYYVGDYEFYGLVNVITKAGDYSLPALPANAIRLAYSVIDPVYSFISPDYSSSEKKRSRTPDFRNTLYWNPAELTDKENKSKIEFWTSDFVSDFLINIQGVTPSGKIFTLKKIIKVRR